MSDPNKTDVILGVTGGALIAALYFHINSVKNELKGYIDVLTYNLNLTSNSLKLNIMRDKSDTISPLHTETEEIENIYDRIERLEKKVKELERRVKKKKC